MSKRPNTNIFLSTFVQNAVLVVGVSLLLSSAVWLFMSDPRMALLWLIGALLGVTLYHAAFGFALGYRQMLVHREVDLVQAQVVMVAVAICLFAPVLATSDVLGQEVVGAVAPFGWQVAAGACMFGIGMQLADGCGSGTLYTVGGGGSKMVFTLASFVAGSFWASLHMDWWLELPSWEPVSLGETMGWPQATAAQLAFLLAIGVLLQYWAKTPTKRLRKFWPSDWQEVVSGPWPLLTGAVALALLNLLTLVTAGHPWSITWAFTLWGAKTATLVGWDPSTSPFWSGDFQDMALHSGILEDVTSVMNIGIVLGALCAAALAGRYMPTLKIPKLTIAAAVLGGLAMGYGARIAFGCNIGAFFSGVASSSLHGWLWIGSALLGAWVGVRIRPWFGLKN
jgi:uncharacterized membrane protein YedE/YeeE